MIKACKNGFRVGGSTENALSRLQIDRRHFQSVGIDYVRINSLDFTQAFDKVKHNLLFEKLHGSQFHYQVVNLFADFLTDRKQYVTMEGLVSKMFSSNWEWFREQWMDHDFSITTSTISSQIRKPQGILVSLMTRPLLLLDTSKLQTKAMKACVRSLKGAK